MYPIGMVKEDGFFCKISLPCCQYGCKKPTVCCSAEQRCLCMHAGAAFPFGGPVPKPVCAICAFRIMPGPPGFMQPYEAGSESKVAPGGGKMERKTAQARG